MPGRQPQELASIAGKDALALLRRDLHCLDGSAGVANEAVPLLGVERSIGCKQGMSAAEKRVPAAGRRALAVHRGIRMEHLEIFNRSPLQPAFFGERVSLRRPEENLAEAEVDLAGE